MRRRASSVTQCGQTTGAGASALTRPHWRFQTVFRIPPGASNRFSTNIKTAYSEGGLSHSSDHIDGVLTSFRAELAQVDQRRNGGWLNGKAWMGQAADPTTAPRTEPWTLEGRHYVRFGETFCRVLRWYKPHKFDIFRPLGWRLSPAVLDRLSAGFRIMIAQALTDSTLTRDQRAWLESFDVAPLSRYTAVDGLFQTVTARPMQVVLDFGSGLGRQALLWSYEREDVAFVSVDVTESLYLLQSELYRRLFGSRLNEYFAAPSFAPSLTPGAVVHLPTWRLDALPHASVDLLIAVQVLQELNEATLRDVLAQFRRLIRPGGLLYIRDNEFWTPSHRVRVGRALLD